MESRQAQVTEGQTATVNFGEEKKIKVSGTVRIGRTPYPKARLMWVPSRRDDVMPGSIVSAVSGEAGEYEVELPEAGMWSVRISGQEESFVGGSGLEVTIPEGGGAKDLIVPEGSITGTVLAASDNKPVDGATVFAVHADDDKDEGEGDDKPAGGSPSGAGRRGAMSRMASATTDKTGAYTLTGLAAGVYHLSASKDGLSEQDLDHVVVGDDGKGQADFLLEAGRDLHVRVLDSDTRPVPRAMLVLMDSNGKPSLMGGRGRITGSDGTLTMTGLKEGTYCLTAVSRDFAPSVSCGVDVSPDKEASTELRVSAGGSLTVKVLDAEGKPVKGVTISLKDPSGVDLEPILPVLRMFSGLPTATSAEGTISFPHLTGGKHTATARLEGGQVLSDSVEILEGKSSALTLKVKPK
jgi:protocatechuate 3,4-dioxygenase beta subunit